MRGVFISYRQDDAKPWALLLRQDLVQAFGEECVFLDKDTLHAGNWREQINEALDRSGVALAGC
jgi:TIR domain-containing protein